MGLGRLQAWMLGLPTAVVYGSLALFISVLHNVFLLYYVDTFVSVYKINKTAFWVGETVFLLWNSLNDPLFGWLSDRQFLSSQPRFVSCGWVTTGPVPSHSSPGGVCVWGGERKRKPFSAFDQAPSLPKVSQALAMWENGLD
uniref:Major facilitator superfamily domain containing 13A n=1 Tax=Felis catus TaxID=9685 RepID=A0ABI7XCL6_FELCA